MKTIKYLLGDATSPDLSTRPLIAHICNDIGAWGKGFVVPLGQKYPKAKLEYKNLRKYKLGDVQFIEIENSNIVIANMIAQRGIYGSKPLREDTLKECLIKVADYVINNQCTVHMPRIGCGLAGGKWKNIKPIIEGTLCNKDISVFVYDLEIN